MAYSKKHDFDRKSGKKGLDLTRDDFCFYHEDLSNVSSLQNSNALNSIMKKVNKRPKEVQCVPKDEVTASSTTTTGSIIHDESVTATENQEIFLKRVWKFVISENQLENRIKDYFQEFQDYYWSLLKMLKSWDSHSSTTRDKNPLYLKTCRIIFDVFQGLKATIEPPSQDLQLASFTLMSKMRVEDENLLQKIKSIFHYDSNSALFVDPIAALVKGWRYSLAAQWIIILQLHERFESSQIVFPLLLQEKTGQATNYLKGMEEASRIKFISFCDPYCQKEKFISYLKLNKIPEIKVTKPRQLAKLVNKLCIRFNILTDRLPNIKKWKGIFAVDSLIHDQYNKNAFNNDDWEEFLRDTIKDDPQLQLEALSLIVNVYEDVGRAYKICKMWRMKKSRLPIELLEKIKSGKGNTLINFKTPVPLKAINNSFPNKFNIVWVCNTLQYYHFIEYLDGVSKLISY